MYFDAIDIFNFHTNGQIFTKKRNFVKLSAPTAPNMWLFSQIFQFFDAIDAKMYIN